MFSLLPCAAEFPEQAPFGWSFEIPSQRSAEETFDLVVDPDLEGEWFPNFHSCHWEKEIGGVGARRIYRLTYARLIEEVTVWEPGHRFQFWISSSTLPFIKRFLEDYRFVAKPDGGCTLHWRICYEVRPLWRPTHPVLRPLYTRDFNTAAQNLETLFS